MPSAMETQWSSPKFITCPDCGERYDNSHKRRLIDTCGHPRCYSCLFVDKPCPLCLSEYHMQTILIPLLLYGGICECWFTRRDFFRAGTVALLFCRLVWVSRLYCSYVCNVLFAIELLKRTCKFEQSSIFHLLRTQKVKLRFNFKSKCSGSYCLLEKFAPSL